LLRDIYGRVLVPDAVLIEMQHSDAPVAVSAWASAPPPWIEQLRAKRIDPTLGKELGAGEREAISLAMEVRADILLIDERAGRQEAEDRHIEVAGTLAVLLQASLRGRFEFPVALKTLRQLGFRVSSNVEAVMLARYRKAKESQR
jgi:predicted nucleic acid-binding protein